jgi:hypothetical protein
LIEAVAYLHSRGIVHRNIKPGNVMLDEHNRVKLTLGFAAIVLTDRSSRQSIFGTPQYVAPEVFVDGAHSAASDVYSTALVCFHALTGTVPFESVTAATLGAAVTKGDRPSWPAEMKANALLAPVLSLVERMWHADGKARPTMGQVQDEFRLLLSRTDGKSVTPVEPSVQSGAAGLFPALRRHQFPIYKWSQLQINEEAGYIAQGAHKRVYRGKLSGSDVAVADWMCAPGIAQKRRLQFVNNIEVLSVPHSRIVTVIGVCIDGTHMAVVMPFYPLSLRERLHGKQDPDLVEHERLALTVAPDLLRDVAAMDAVPHPALNAATELAVEPVVSDAPDKKGAPPRPPTPRRLPLSL